MHRIFQIFALLLCLNSWQVIKSQSNNPAPYAGVSYFNVPCNQTGPSNTPGNFINDFINTFNTVGAVNNITNNNSGCCGLPNNYIYYGCQHFLVLTAGQTITCTLQSGIIFAQGFAIFIDWNNDNIFSNTTEKVAASSNAPTAATFTTLIFTVPLLQGPGTYRMRVRCSFAIGGTGFDAYGQQSFGETEDYNVYIGTIPSTYISGTVTASSPICAGQPIGLTIAHSSTGSPTYTWTGPASFSSSLQNPIISPSTTSMSGTYSVVVSNGACPLTKTVSVVVVPYPTYNLTPPTATICQGGITIGAIGSLSGGTSSFTYSWTGPGSISSPIQTSTQLQPPQQPPTVPVGTVFYSITVTPTLAACAVTKVMTVTIHNPLTPTLTMPLPLCNISTPVQLTAVPGGGTWSANGAVAPNGIFTPGLASIGTNTVVYSVSVGNCVLSNSGTLHVSRFHTPALITGLSKCVQDPAFRLMNIVQDTTTGFWNGQNVTNNYFNPAGLPTGNYALTYSSPSSPDPTVCPSSTVLIVPVFNPPTPIINPIAPRCNNSGTVSLTATPLGGTWSGNSGVSSGGVQTPSLNQVPNNSVFYTAGQGTCVASASRTFHVSKFNTAALSGTISPLCVSSLPVNLMAIVQNTNGGWSGISVSNNIFTPTGLPTNTYSVVYNTYSTPTTTLCPDSTRMAISVLNPQNSTIMQAGPYCNTSAPVQMTVSPATGQWVTSSYLSASGVFTPSLSPVGINMVQYIIGTSTCNAQSTSYVSIEAFVPATIIQQVPPLCNTRAVVSLLPLTINTLGTWSGPGVNGTNYHPAASGAGNFNLVYKTTSSPSGMCPDADTLAVIVYSLATPVIGQEGPFCNTAPPLQLKVSPLGGIFAGVSEGALSLGGLFNPALANVGPNIISYSIAAGPCIAYAQTSIQIEEFVSADFEKQLAPAYCKNQPAFNLNSLVKNPNGSWSGPGVIGSMFDPSKANLGDNNFIIYHTHSMPNALLCPDTSAVRIKVKDIPKVIALNSVSKGCAPVVVTFNSPNTNTGKGSWNLGDGSEPKTGFVVTYTYTKPGTYHVLYTYKDGEAEGCTAAAKVQDDITVLPMPQADFSISPDEVTISAPEITLTNLSSVLQDNQYLWTVQQLGQFFEIDPRITLPQIGTYKITLQATSIYGCKDEMSKTIEVKNDFNVFIPNSFTPNLDGVNDYFKPVFSPYGLDPKTYEMDIYDRWGHVVYNTKDHTKGWDGTLRNNGDFEMKQDVYTYRIKFKDLDGREYYKNGALTLLK